MTSAVDLVTARQLIENEHLSFQGVVLRGPFNISESHARRMIATSNSDATYLNSSVIKPRRTGEDIAQRSSNEYVVDFGLDTDIEIAKKYEAPFAYLAENVYPMRQKANQVAARERWWIHWNPRTEMRSAISKVSRYIATPRVSKHRIFVWLDSKILPDAQLVIFASEDDYFFGVLHSYCHELWSRRLGTQLRDAESGFRYTPTTTCLLYTSPSPRD